MLPLSIWNTLETVRDTVLSGKIETISSSAALLAAILAAASLLKLSKDYIQGQPLDIWDLLRPIVLLTLVCLFRPLVLGPLDSLVNVFTRDVADAVSVSTGEYVEQWSENIASIGREQQKHFLTYCQRLIRENFIYNFKDTTLVYLNNEEQNFSNRFSPFINEQNVIGIMNELNEAQRHIEQNVNARMVFFDFALKMIVLLVQK